MKLFLAILAVIFFIIPAHNLRAQVTQSLNIEKMVAQQKYGYGPIFNKQSQRNSGLNKKTAPNSQVYCPDTLTTYESNGNTRYMDIYNQKGLTTQRLIQYYSNGQWLNYSLDSWTYFNANNNSNDVEQLWVNNQWINHSLDSSTYDSKGQMLVHLFKHWSQGAWKDSILSFRTYDANENMLTNIGELWSGTQWINSPESQTYSYTYDASGHKLTELYQILINGQMENATLSTYTYDANGNMLSYLLQISANGQMTNSTLHEYTYDTKGKMLTDLFKGWSNTAWINGSLYTYSYDANGNMVNVLVQYSFNSQWTNLYQTTYTYDSHGNLVVGYNNDWVNSSWVQADNPFTIPFYDGSTYTFTGYKITISYSLLNITDVSATKNNVVTEYSLFQNYPNPFNPSTTISFRLPSKLFVSLKVFDIMGREVATLASEELSAGFYNRQWNASNMSSGIYFYRLQAGNYLESKKLILLK